METLFHIPISSSHTNLTIIENYVSTGIPVFSPPLITAFFILTSTCNSIRALLCATFLSIITVS